jgi:hypothetical protein
VKLNRFVLKLWGDEFFLRNKKRKKRKKPNDGFCVNGDEPLVSKIKKRNPKISWLAE